MALRIYNTLSRSIEVFEPSSSGEVRMYHCGPTVYRDQHIGNFRAYLMADLLRRYFELRGFRVTQVMNITDVGHLTTDDLADAQGEDKLEKSARELNLDPYEIARRYEGAFFANIDALGIRRAHHYPRATEHIGEMIDMIATLIESGNAYVVDGVGVYFRVSSYDDYGALSGNTLEELDSGARIEVDERKESPLDFALWKIDPKHLMQWDSPWGRGFPGWHIECSAMSRKYLGDSFDVHTGGEDNIFPHHECERAQSRCATEGHFARYWIHARFLLVDGTKMSKSLDNFYTLEDLQARGYSGIDLRYALISAHYRQQANFTLKGLADARKNVERLCTFRERLEAWATGDPSVAPRDAMRDLLQSARDGFDAALDDDLNISGALGVLFERIRLINREGGELLPSEAHAFLDWLRDLDAILGVIFTAADTPREELPPAVEKLLRQREQARATRDWDRADRLRDELRTHGIEVKDTPQGTEWRRR